MKKRKLLCLLLSLVLLCAAALPSLPAAAAEDGAAVADGCTCGAENGAHAQDCPLYASSGGTLADRTLLQQENGLSFQLTGMLPEDATLSVNQLEEEVNSYIRERILQLEQELPEGCTQAAYDISLQQDGAEYEPSGEVTVRIFGDFTADSQVQIYHLPGASAEDVYAAYQQEVFGISTMRAGTGGAALTGQQIAPVTVGDGYCEFTTDGFSVYYVVSGTNGYSTWETNASELSNEDVVTYYIEAGTTLTFINATGVTWTRTSGDGSYFTTNGSTFTVSASASVGTTATYTFSWQQSGSGGWPPQGGQTYTATLTFIVSDHNEIIKASIDAYPVILSVLDYSQNSSAYGTMPSEPGVTLDVNYRHIYQSGGNYAVQNARITFADSSTGIIRESIVDALTVSTDGSSTVGLYDADGSDCKTYITGIDWDKVLTALANLNAVKATDGTTLNTGNKDQYEVIPYVVKLMSATDVGWHIDCVVKPKADVTLSYDLNLKNFVAPGITLPSTSVGKAPLTAKVGAISLKINDSTTVELKQNDTISATLNGEEYTKTFLGWSTDPNATQAEYQPGASITINENTVLYAVWLDEKATGTLKIEKTVTKAYANDKLPDDEFTFTVTLAKEGTYSYTVYRIGDDATAVRTGSLASGGTLTLQGGQYALIEKAPAGAYTVTEAEDEDYTTTKTGDSGSITGGQTATASFQNEYKRHLADLTIRKTGAQAVDENQSFLFTVTGSDGFQLDVVIHGNGSVTIRDLPLGSYTVTENTGWSWRYTASPESQSIALSATEENSVLFANTRSVLYWLSGDNYLENQFAVNSTAQGD